MQKCGCKAYPVNNSTVIEYCPLHAAAPDLLALTDELLQVCDWFGSTVNSLRLGETIDTHPDWNAVEYLESQAQGIRIRAADAIAGACPERQSKGEG